jgi:Ca2+-transporting ATPase
MSITQDQVKKIQGLTDERVQELQRSDGFNELPSAKKKSIFHIIFEVMKEPMFLLLVACGALYLILGDKEEAIMLLGFVGVIIGITVYQEGKTEKALDALRDLSSPRALVIRNGERKRIAGREVVRGDYMILAEGDRVPADAVLLWSLGLTIDESLLTGESVPVRKAAGDGDETGGLPKEMGAPGGEDLPFVFSGTLVVQGQGVALVRGIGGTTEMGKIGKALQEVEPEETLIKVETGKIVRATFIVAVALSAIVMIVYGITQTNWIQGILSALTLAMAMLPEEFPVVLTVFLALGAWRMSKKKVLTRKVAAIETLGAATVFCVDKTGTLTQNRMSIQKLYASGEVFDVGRNGHADIPETFHELVEHGILASKRDPFDPMEQALVNLGKHKLAHTEHLHEDWELVQEYPLSRELLALSHVWVSPNRRDYCISAKGAPEAIMDLCHLTPETTARLEGSVQELAAQGLRVLGVAQAGSASRQAARF